jgi:hypothetical protein
MNGRALRVVVALDPGAPRDEAFEAVAALLDPARAEVTALFIEDDNLARLAALPGVREVRSGPEPRTRALDPVALERQLTERAARVRRTCERAAARQRLQLARFLIRRGEVLAELERAARDSELLVVGRSLRSAASRSWLGAAPEHVTNRLHRTNAGGILFVHEPWRTGTTVLVLADGGADDESGRRAVEQARMLTAAEALPLRTLEDPTLVNDVAALAAACSDADARVLVLPRSAVADAGALARLLAELPASVLLTR